MGFILCGVSLLTMTTISVDRFAALHYHMRYVTIVTTPRVVYALIICGFCLLLPQVFTSGIGLTILWCRLLVLVFFFWYHRFLISESSRLLINIISTFTFNIRLCKVQPLQMLHTLHDWREVLSTPWYFICLWFCAIFPSWFRCVCTQLQTRIGRAFGILQTLLYSWTHLSIQFCTAGVLENFGCQLFR